MARSRGIGRGSFLLALDELQGGSAGFIVADDNANDDANEDQDHTEISFC